MINRASYSKDFLATENTENFYRLLNKLSQKGIEHRMIQVQYVMPGLELEEERFGPSEVDDDFWIVITKNKPVLKAWFKARNDFHQIHMECAFSNRPIMKAWREGQIAGGYYDNRRF